MVLFFTRFLRKVSLFVGQIYVFRRLLSVMEKQFTLLFPLLESGGKRKILKHLKCLFNVWYVKKCSSKKLLESR